jgi:hypothetical protein
MMKSPEYAEIRQFDHKVHRAQQPQAKVDQTHVVLWLACLAADSVQVNAQNPQI